MVININTYLNDIDTEQVTKLLNETQENTQYFQDIVSKVVQTYCIGLDQVMKDIYTDIIQVDYPATEIIEKYFLSLSNYVYFMGEKLEMLGTYDAMSKSAYKQVYNTAYLNNQVKDVDKKNKTTVAENQAIAENAALYEGTVNDIYNRAYKIVKNKIDAAQTMISTLSKVLSKRIQEQQFSQSQNNISKILNE